MMLHPIFRCLALVAVAYGIEDQCNAVHNALVTPGVRCTASSAYPGYPCSKAYDRKLEADFEGSWASQGEDSGAWLEFTFPRDTTLTSAVVWSRCVLRDQYKGIDFVFSDGSKQMMSLTCNDGSSTDWRNCDGVEMNKIDLQDIRTTSVRMEFHKTCLAGGNPGIREVEFQAAGTFSGQLQIEPQPLKHGVGWSCSASSAYPNYPCSKVFDNNLSADSTGAWASKGQDTGAWLEITFPHLTTLRSTEIWSRCNLYDQYKGVDLIFSDRSKQTMSLTCDAGASSVWTNCIGVEKDVFDLEDVRTTSVRLEFHESCKAGGNPGIREIKFPDKNSILNPAKMSCTASTSYPGYPCSRVYDGNLAADSVGSWASVGQDSGSWVEVTFPSQTTVGSMTIWSRCVLVDQYKGVDLIFSDGSEQTMSLTCDGGTSTDWRVCTGVKEDTADIQDVLTSSVRMEFHESCKAGGNPGIREVQFGA